MNEIIKKLSVLAEDIKKCKLEKFCPELDESRQYYFEPNHVTLAEWQKYEQAFRNGINTDAVFLCESPGGFAKGVNPPGFPADGSEIYRGWATEDLNDGIQISKLRNNKKFKEFRQKTGLDDCYITNICKCGKIPKPRTKHTNHEISLCSKFLKKELEIINPNLIIVVGKKLAGYLNKLDFLKPYDIIYMTHYSYFVGCTAWDFWKQPGEGGELDEVIKKAGGRQSISNSESTSIQTNIKNKISEETKSIKSNSEYLSKGRNKIQELEFKLRELVKEINASINPHVSFDQQRKKKEHMSLIGCNGRMFILPTSTGYDVSISGMSVEKNLYPFLKDLFGKDCDGYRQPNSRVPKWKTDDFDLVKQAALIYAKTTK
jgi:hypothetical protein